MRRAKVKKQRRIVDFPDDPMLQELHDIGRGINDEIKGLSPKEVSAYFHKKAEEAARHFGYKHVPTGRGTYRLVKEALPSKRMAR